MSSLIEQQPTSTPWWPFAAGAVALTIFTVPLVMGATDPVLQAKEALEKGQAPAAQALLLEAHNKDPDNAEVIMWQGFVAAELDELDAACVALKEALAKDPELARQPRLARTLVDLVNAKNRCARDELKSWTDDPKRQQTQVWLHLARKADRRRYRKTGYEVLQKLDELDELNPSVWLTSELEKVAGAGCSVRRWYVLELIKLDDPAHRPIFEKQLSAKDKFVGVFSRSSCMQKQLREALNQ